MPNLVKLLKWLAIIILVSSSEASTVSKSSNSTCVLQPAYPREITRLDDIAVNILSSERGDIYLSIAQEAKFKDRSSVRLQPV